MSGVSIKPILRLIARHGEEIIHRRLPAAVAASPWEIDDTAPVATVMATHKGLINRIRAARPDDDLPGGGFRAVAVLALPRAAARPVPGDVLEAGGVGWRIEAIAPLARHRSGDLFEAQLVAHGTNSMKGSTP